MVYWPQDDAWYTGTVGVTGPHGLTHIAYEDGDKEDLDMSKEKYEVLPAVVQEIAGRDAALQERWKGELGDCSLIELAVRMQGESLGDNTVANYWPKARAFTAFCEVESKEWLPATGATGDEPPSLAESEMAVEVLSCDLDPSLHLDASPQLVPQAGTAKRSMIIQSPGPANEGFPSGYHWNRLICLSCLLSA
ncbi:hypothetical protein CYMTET_52773 [Cymbomonas tetramitiformis]|uniref:Uncharacterized protein n=1 Tax=Cymbomonas tetramitiformis TaxID=36881 RepID=A0AAE0BIJ3_9CHLO|nr:hypothetical protein CYMTET_52773 [Cymbomonas tetramitiformis]